VKTESEIFDRALLCGPNRGVGEMMEYPAANLAWPALGMSAGCFDGRYPVSYSGLVASEAIRRNARQTQAWGMTEAHLPTGALVLRDQAKALAGDHIG
jgi:hypothetical protein